MNEEKSSKIFNEISTPIRSNSIKHRQKFYSFKLRNKSDSSLLRKLIQREDLEEKRTNLSVDNINLNTNEDTPIIQSDEVAGWLYQELDLIISNWKSFSEDYITNFLHRWERHLRHESNVQYLVQNNRIVLHKFITKLIPCLIDNLKWEFIVLNSFQSIFKYFLKYPEVINILLIKDETNTEYPWFQWIITIISRVDDFRSIKLKCHSLSLLLKLFESNIIHRNSNLNEIIWNIIQNDLSSWIKQLNEMLMIASSPMSINDSINKIIHLGRVNDLIPKFILLSLDLFINLIDSFHSITTRYIILKQLKVNQIHDFFYHIDSLRDSLTFDLSQINKQIQKYKDLEKSTLIQKNQTLDDSLFNKLSIYNKDLTLLLERTDHTPLQTYLNEIFEHLVKFIDKNPYDESINVFKFIDYMSNYFNLQNNDKSNLNRINASNNGFKDYVERLMDNLQSDEIAKRAMEQLHESKDKIQKLTSKLESLQNLTVLQNNNNMVFQELKQANILLDEKDNELESLTLQNRRLEEQLRRFNSEIERINTHQRWYGDLSSNNMKNRYFYSNHSNNDRNHSTLFETMKDPFNKKRDIHALQKKSSMKSSQRLNSLSSILQKTDDNNQISINSGNPFLKIPLTDTNNNNLSMNNETSKKDSTISNIETMSQLKYSFSTPYKTSNLTNTGNVNPDPRNNTSPTIIVTKLNLPTEVSQTININQHQNYETQHSISLIESRFIPQPPPSLPAASNSPSNSTPSSINEPTIFGSRIPTSTSSLLSTDSINDFSIDNNVPLECTRTNSNSTFNIQTNSSLVNMSQIKKNNYPYENSLPALSSHHTFNNTASSFEVSNTASSFNFNNSDMTLNIINTDSKKTQIANNIPSAPPLPPNLAMFSNTQNGKSPSTSRTVTLPSTPLHTAPPPPPPPLPNNLSLISLTDKDTSKEKIYPSTKILDSGTPLKECTITITTTAAAAAPPPPPSLPISLTRAVPPSSKDSTTSLKQDLEQQVPPPPPLPHLPSSLKKVGEKVDLSVDTSTNVKLGCVPLPLTVNKSNTMKLKQIHWEKIENIDGTLWNNFNGRRVISKELQMDGIFTEIEKKFKIKESVNLNNLNNNHNSGRDGNSLNNKQSVSYLSRDLQQQFGINLHMFSNLTVDELVTKVLNCDNDIIKNVSVLEFFSKDELTNIPPSLARKYEPYVKDNVEGDLPVLERTDEIFLKLCYKLRSYWSPRSKCLLVLSTYERDYYDLIYKLQKIDTAISQLKKSEAFKDILYIIVEIGNYMNIKRVEGIKISSLSKLIFLKSSVNSNDSFLHFIERCVRKKYPELMSFLQDLNTVEDMGRTTIDQLKLECKEYCCKVDSMYYSVTRGKLSNPDDIDPRDQILNKVKYKSTRAKTKSDLLKNRLELTLSDMEELVKYYGEDYKDIEVRNKFFRQFIEFIQLFKKCNKENMEKEEMERLYNERNKTQILIEDDNDGKANEKSTVEGNETGASKIDKLLTKLRDVEKSKNKNSKHTISDDNSSSTNQNNNLSIRKKREKRNFRNKTKGKDTNYTTNNNDGKEQNNETKPALLQRAQTMLNNIQKI